MFITSVKASGFIEKIDFILYD